MVRRSGLSWMLVILWVLLAAGAAKAQWIKDGVPIGSAEYTQYQPKIASDGMGGAIVVWSDLRSGMDYDIYGNRISGDGNYQGPGVPLCMAPGNQYMAGLLYDGAGNLIVVWMDERFGNAHIYAQKADTMGNVYWATDGLDICPYSNSPGNPVVISDGAGGAIIAWNDYRESSNDIFAQRVDANGTLLWGDSGAVVSALPAEQYGPAIVGDGAGGAIIAWTDYRGDGDIYAQRIDASGAILWDTLGMPVCAAYNNQYNVRLRRVPGGAIALWSDTRNWYEDVFAQRIDSDGMSLWDLDGVSVCDDAGSGYYKWAPVIVPDNAGGAIVVWGENRYQDYYELFGQRFESDGTRAWGALGTKIIPCYSWDGELAITPDGAGGAIVAAGVYWDEESDTDIWAQKVDHDGVLPWGSNGMPVCAASNSQYSPVIMSDGSGGAIMAWEDYRDETGGNSDVYCQRLGSAGFWGDPVPVIVSCADVPDDQGGWVRIRTMASMLDKAGEDPAIFGYNVWRLIGGSGPTMVSSTAALPADRASLLSLLSDPVTAAGVRVSAAQAAALGLPEGEWESVGFWFATRDTVYNIAVPTKDDSTEAGTPWETFIVTAHTSIAGVFIPSEPATGYSIDNLAPGMTPGFEANEVADPAGLMLSWSPNAASDLWKYDIYRGDEEAFVPDGSNLLGSTTGTALLDGSWVKAYQYFYKLVAVDRHGNPSPAALIRPEDIKVGMMLQSFAAALRQSAIEISWTLSEIDENAELRASRTAGGDYAELSEATIEREGLSFSVVDRSVEPGTTYRYRVSVVDEAGSRVLFETDEITTPAMPLTLNQNHPNPFNPSTTISYYLPAAAAVTLDVYDTAGRLVTRFLNQENQPRGAHSVEWRGVDAQGRAVSSGVYFYRIRCGKDVISKKMILLR